MRNYLLHTFYASAFMLCSFLILPCFLSNNFNNGVIENYDTIIVLGGGVITGCKLDLSMQSRMNTAFELYRQNKSAKMIFTGGPTSPYQKCVESEAMRQYALKKNISEIAIIKESLSLNTYQNAYQTTNLMRELGLNKALIVTSDFHTRRADYIFQQYDITFSMVAAPNKSMGERKYKELLKEQVLLCFHTIFGLPDRFGLDLKEQKLAAVLKSLAQR